MPIAAGFATPDIRWRSVAIYALATPGGEIRYVGRSSDPESRYWNHMGAHATPPMKRWVAEMRARGECPSLIILHVVTPGEDAGPAELYFIKLHGRSGRLLNSPRSSRAKHCRYCFSNGHLGNRCKSDQRKAA